ncbi:flagellar biosynthetic protein FliO [Paenibacillus sp. y28]|uniref:flagellar biosynthetic protein FliO n=1 Tax=Paenibacillus sp. y28 TaxID=3129110 RepID=UPI00301A8F50
MKLSHKSWFSIFLCCIFVLCVLYLPHAAAEGDTIPGLKSSPETAGLQTESFGWTLTKVLFSLLFIIGIFVVLIRILAQKNKKWMRSSAIRSLGGLPLGQNKSVQVVEIGSSIYILGVGDDIRLLRVVQDEEEVSDLQERFEIGLGGEWLNGMTVLNRLLKRDKQTTTPSDEEISSFHEVFHEKMKKVSSRKKMVEEMLHDDK